MLQSFPMYAYIPVANLARARQFYEQKLGFKPAREVAGGVIYECGDSTAEEYDMPGLLRFAQGGNLLRATTSSGGTRVGLSRANVR